MAAAAPPEPLANFNELVDELERESDNPLFTTYCHLIRFAANRAHEPFDSEERKNANLAAHGFNRNINRRNEADPNTTRGISTQEFLFFELELETTIQSFMSTAYSRAIKKTVLKKAIQEFASKVGSKQFAYRYTKFILFLKSIPFLQRHHFTEQEVSELILRPYILGTLFAYWKDGTNQAFVRTYLAGYERLIQGYNQHTPTFIEFIVQVNNEKRAARDPEADTSLKALLMEYATLASVSLDEVFRIFSRFLPPEQIATLRALPVNMNAEVYNNFGLSCPGGQIETRNCPAEMIRRTYRACRDEENPLKIDEINEICSRPINGGKRRKATRKSRKTRRRRRRSTRSASRPRL